MFVTNVDVGVFNVLRYAMTSLLLVPCLEWALQSIVESFGTKHLMRGGIVRWGGHRLGRLSPVPYSYSRQTRFFAIAAGVFIHSASLLGEYGFGAEQLVEMEATRDLFRTNASAVPAYIPMCDGRVLRIHFLDLDGSYGSLRKNITEITEIYRSESDCEIRVYDYMKRSGYDYRLLWGELMANINSVSSTISENADLDWVASKCLSGRGGGGVIRYNFALQESKTKRFGNRTIDLRLEAVDTTMKIPYICDSDGTARISVPAPTHNMDMDIDIENVTSLRIAINHTGIVLKRNKTFACLGTEEFFGFFCFSNSTSSVGNLYHSVGAMVPNTNTTYTTSGHGDIDISEQIYLLAKFDPPVDVSRMYFILSGLQNYQPIMRLFSGHEIGLVMRYYSNLGSVLTLLAGMHEVLAPEVGQVGQVVNSISATGKMVATIDVEGLSCLGLLSLATILTLLLALVFMLTGTRDSKGRLVKVRAEPKYVIDLIASDILGNEDRAAHLVSDFGIALTSYDRGRHQIGISREGVAYNGEMGEIGGCGGIGGEIICERPEHAHGGTLGMLNRFF